METDSSILARKIMCLEDHGGLQSIESQSIEWYTSEVAELSWTDVYIFIYYYYLFIIYYYMFIYLTDFWCTSESNTIHWVNYISKKQKQFVYTHYKIIDYRRQFIYTYWPPVLQQGFLKIFT